MKTIKLYLAILLVLLILPSCRNKLPLKVYSGYYWELYGSNYKFLGNNTVLRVAREHLIPHDTIIYDFAKYKVRNNTVVLIFRPKDSWNFRRKLIYIDSLDRFVEKNGIGEFIKSNGNYMDSILINHQYIKNHY